MSAAYVVASLDADALREDWKDNQDLTPEQRVALNEFDDESLTEALEDAAGDAFWQAFDAVKTDATALLLDYLEEGP